MNACCSACLAAPFNKCTLAAGEVPNIHLLLVDLLEGQNVLRSVITRPAQRRLVAQARGIDKTVTSQVYNHIDCTGRHLSLFESIMPTVFDRRPTGQISTRYITIIKGKYPLLHLVVFIVELIMISLLGTFGSLHDTQ